MVHSVSAARAASVGSSPRRALRASSWFTVFSPRRASMSIVDDFTAAFNRQDVAALVACFTPTASYVDNFYGEHRGVDELDAMFTRMFREGRNYVWRNDAIIESPGAGKVATEWSFGYIVTDAL